MTHIIIGIIVIIVGFFMVWKTEAFYNFVGAISWAEEHFGGTRTFLKVLGVAFIFLGFMTIFQLYSGVLDLVFRR